MKNTFDKFMEDLVELCIQYDVKLETEYSEEHADFMIVVSNVFAGEGYVSTLVQNDFVEELKIH